ncbi:MAG: hypothetical protein DMG32_02275 [Acidobacteria bacterium]|nr:MAG: hypothetical protein DMG32_02275 [Acidobacteriota bacterium]
MVGFAIHVTSPVIAVNGKMSCDQENAQDSHSKPVCDLAGFESKYRRHPAGSRPYPDLSFRGPTFFVGPRNLSERSLTRRGRLGMTGQKK